MMTLRPPSTVAALAAFALAVGTSANADIVLYSEDFSGDDTTNLHGTTPDTTIGSSTWIAHENWKADGSIAGGTSLNVPAADHSAFLAFTPTAGTIYTLSATLDKPDGGASGMWAGIGFTNDTLGTAVGNNGESFFAGTNAAGPWMLWRANNDQIAAFGGPGTANGSGNLAGYGTGPQTLTIVLDTTDTAWKAEWFVGNDSIYTFTYTTNPTISYIGLGRENNAAADFSSFSLTVIPEPSAALLGGLGMLCLLRRRR